MADIYLDEPTVCIFRKRRVCTSSIQAPSSFAVNVGDSRSQMTRVKRLRVIQPAQLDTRFQPPVPPPLVEGWWCEDTLARRTPKKGAPDRPAIIFPVTTVAPPTTPLHWSESILSKFFRKRSARFSSIQSPGEFIPNQFVGRIGSQITRIKKVRPSKPEKLDTLFNPSAISPALPEGWPLYDVARKTLRSKIVSSVFRNDHTILLELFETIGFSDSFARLFRSPLHAPKQEEFFPQLVPFITSPLDWSQPSARLIRRYPSKPGEVHLFQPPTPLITSLLSWTEPVAVAIRGRITFAVRQFQRNDHTILLELFETIGFSDDSSRLFRPVLRVPGPEALIVTPPSVPFVTSPLDWSANAVRAALHKIIRDGSELLLWNVPSTPPAPPFGWYAWTESAIRAAIHKISRDGSQLLLFGVPSTPAQLVEGWQVFDMLGKRHRSAPSEEPCLVILKEPVVAHDEGWWTEPLATFLGTPTPRIGDDQWWMFFEGPPEAPPCGWFVDEMKARNKLVVRIISDDIVRLISPTVIFTTGERWLQVKRELALLQSRRSLSWKSVERLLYWVVNG